MPLIAVTVTISGLGFARDARPIRVLETAIRMVIGIALSEALLRAVGNGLWQFGPVLLVTLMVARMLSASDSCAVAAGGAVHPGDAAPGTRGGPFARGVDGIVGGRVAGW